MQGALATGGGTMKKIRCEHCGQMTRYNRTGESPQQKSARIRRTQRLLRDEAQAVEMAALVRQGLTTEGARQQMRMGVVRAQRVRAVAVRLGLVSPRVRGRIGGTHAAILACHARRRTRLVQVRQT
jgi:hypothetical protein